MSAPGSSSVGTVLVVAERPGDGVFDIMVSNCSDGAIARKFDVDIIVDSDEISA